jgi:hypothetical protein
MNNNNKSAVYNMCLPLFRDWHGLLDIYMYIIEIYSS